MPLLSYGNRGSLALPLAPSLTKRGCYPRHFYSCGAHALTLTLSLRRERVVVIVGARASCPYLVH
jgi:hypothetical protein